MSKENILKRIGQIEAIENAVDKPSPVGAFAPEIKSNEYVVGNQNSQMLHNYIVDKDNGLQKLANENKYLEKIAFAWIKRLGKNIKEAEPITQLGVGTTLLGTGLSLNRTMSSSGMAKRDLERTRREQNSLKALHSINKSISTNVMSPSSVPIKKIGKI